MFFLLSNLVKKYSIWINSINIVLVFFLPQEFNGNILFKLLPKTMATTMVEQMQGMDRKHDVHPWYVVKTTHIKKNYGLNFRWIACVGHLSYAVEDCPSLLWDGKPIEVHQEGATDNAFLPIHVPFPHSAIVDIDFVTHPLYVFWFVMLGSVMLCTNCLIWLELASILVRTIISCQVVIMMNWLKLQRNWWGVNWKRIYVQPFQLLLWLLVKHFWATNYLSLVKHLQWNYKGPIFMDWWVDFLHFLHPTSRIFFHPFNMEILDMACWITFLN